MDYNPEELARQFTLLDFDYLNAIKPLEYLNLHKSLASFFQEEQQEEDPETVKESPHIVAVNYRFTDVIYVLGCCNLLRSEIGLLLKLSRKMIKYHVLR